MSARIKEKELNTIKGAGIFSSLDQDSFNRIVESISIKELSRCETIFYQDDEADFFYVVLEGWVKLYQLSLSGEEAIVSVIKPQQSFAESAIFGDTRYQVTAEAVSSAVIACIPTSGLIGLIREKPEIGLSLLTTMSEHQHDLYRQVVRLKSHTGAQRVGHFLLDLCGGDTGAMTIILPHDKSLIAGCLGMKPESLSRAFQRLKSYGVSVAHNTAKIDCVDRLFSFVSEDRAVVLQRHHRQFERRAA